MDAIVAGALVGVVVAAVAVAVWAELTSSHECTDAFPGGRSTPRPDASTAGPPTAATRHGHGEPSRMTTTLDVPSSLSRPAAERLAEPAAFRILASSPSLTEVEVLARDGSSLGQFHRPAPVRLEPPMPKLEPSLTMRRVGRRHPDEATPAIERAAQNHHVLLDTHPPAGPPRRHRALA
ncbi:MAG TPA: hypothetical protein VKY26_05930, partial [Actinomycetota bacterium]|nr:hypothetical protein [Actinomycetota bacterium]